MKISSFINFLKEGIREDDYSYLNDELDMNTWGDNAYNDDDDDEFESDDLQHLHYLLRQMFKNSGIDNVDVSGKHNLIIIGVHLDYKSNLREVIKVIEVVSKIKKDILPQYDSEVDMWRTKDYKPILTFTFNYDEGLDDDNVSF
jgi:2-phospho-L-lactate transferase/gluconeogenesis factor (CofD/UPF0052 family)